MLKAIIAREFLNNILNLRFMIGLVLCIIVTIACIMILVHDYQQEMKDYNGRVNIQDDILNNYANAKFFSLWQMIRPQTPPERFRPLIIGIPGNEELKSFYDNPLSILFPSLDFLFIVTIIMSLLAILFSHDAIARERQNGTLRLVIANSISRTQILLGKFIGGIASLIIPFILSLLIGALYISVNPSIQWDGSAWAELTLSTIASITFITLFYLLGLMISTFSRYPATSILNCLFFWVLLILVIPNICPYISAQIYRIPSIKETQRRREEIKIQSIKVAGERIKESAKKLRDKYGERFFAFESMKFGGLGSFYLFGRDLDLKYQKEAQQRADTDPQFKAMMNAFREAVEEAIQESYRIQNESGDKLTQDLGTKVAAQSRFAKNLACISPFANLVYVLRDLTGTGLRSLDYIERTKAEYRENQIRPYLYKKLQDAKQKNPTLSEETLLDVSDRPRFVFKEESLRGKLNAALPYWGILVLFNVLFFVVAFAGFVRYDVR